MSEVSSVNIYRDETSRWYFAAWVWGEFDCSYEIEDVESEEDAIAYVRSLWPTANIKRIAELDFDELK
jgi:uncharacterized membrane protein